MLKFGQGGVTRYFPCTRHVRHVALLLSASLLGFLVYATLVIVLLAQVTYVHLTLVQVPPVHWSRFEQKYAASGESFSDVSENMQLKSAVFPVVDDPK